MAAGAPEYISAPRGHSPTPDSILVLTCRLGNLSIAVPVAALERILPMVMLTPLPEMPPAIVGMLNLHGANLLVVDPRPLLGLPTPPFLPDQRLIVLHAGSRFVVWVDTVQQIVQTPFDEAPQGAMTSERALVRHIVNPDGETTLVLALEALEPGSGGTYREVAEQT